MLEDTYIAEKVFLSDLLAGRTQWLFDGFNKLNLASPIEERKIAAMVRDYIQNSFALEKAYNHKLNFQTYSISRECVSSATRYLQSLFSEHFKGEPEKGMLASVLMSIYIGRNEAEFDRFAGTENINVLNFDDIVKLYILSGKV